MAISNIALFSPTTSSTSSDESGPKQPIGGSSGPDSYEGQVPPVATPSSRVPTSVFSSQPTGGDDSLVSTLDSLLQQQKSYDANQLECSETREEIAPRWETFETDLEKVASIDKKEADQLLAKLEEVITYFETNNSDNLLILLRAKIMIVVRRVELNQQEIVNTIVEFVEHATTRANHPLSSLQVVEELTPIFERLTHTFPEILDASLNVIIERIHSATGNLTTARALDHTALKMVYEYKIKARVTQGTTLQTNPLELARLATSAFEHADRAYYAYAAIFRERSMDSSCYDTVSDKEDERDNARAQDRETLDKIEKERYIIFSKMMKAYKEAILALPLEKQEPLVNELAQHIIDTIRRRPPTEVGAIEYGEEVEIDIDNEDVRKTVLLALEQRLSEREMHFKMDNVELSGDAVRAYLTEFHPIISIPPDVDLGDWDDRRDFIWSQLNRREQRALSSSDLWGLRDDFPSLSSMDLELLELATLDPRFRERLVAGNIRNDIVREDEVLGEMHRRMAELESGEIDTAATAARRGRDERKERGKGPGLRKR